MRETQLLSGTVQTENIRPTNLGPVVLREHGVESVANTRLRPGVAAA